MNLVSCSRTCFAFGPGSCVSRRGSFASCDFVSFNLVSGVAIISSSFKDGWRDCGWGRINLAIGSRHSGEWRSRGMAALCVYTRRVALGTAFLKGDLIYAEEVWPEVGRRGNSSERVDVGDFHLRFQRTLPSLLSSRIIP